MKLRILMLGTLLGLWNLPASAQVNITMSYDRESFLLYESIPVKVDIANVGDQLITLDNNAEGFSPWISFLIFQADGSKVRTEQPISVPPLSIAPGEKGSVMVDLTPAYSIRATGQYQVQTVVTVPGRKPFITDSRVFFIGKGDLIWKEEKQESGTRRIYSLIKFLGRNSDGIYTDLYVRVEEPSTNTVFGTQRLGRFTAFTSPVTQFDASNGLHIVHTVSGQNYRYSAISAEGVLIGQEDRQIAGQRPSLVQTEEGGVRFIGGTPLQEKKVRPKLSQDQQGLM
ncbi:MAG: hypothetical protein HC904_12040 [Blastochloris sp.]|nr:hypothetical protein [Blastochloris sp.]